MLDERQKIIRKHKYRTKKREIGDVVTIAPKLEEWFPFGINEMMKTFCGKKVTIIERWKIGGDIGYAYRIKGSSDSWNEFMFVQETWMGEYELE